VGSTLSLRKMKKKVPKIQDPSHWSFSRETPILIVTVDLRDSRKIPGVHVVYANTTREGLAILRKAKGDIGSVLFTKDLTEAESDENGIVVSLSPLSPQSALDKAQKTEKGSFAKLFHECEIFNKKDLVLLLLELDILTNPQRYPGILPYKPDPQSLIDSYAASRELLIELHKERERIYKNEPLFFSPEEMGIKKERTKKTPLNPDPPSLRRFQEAYQEGVDSFCRFIEDLDKNVLMSDVVKRLYEMGMSNKEVKNFYKYYYVEWKGGRI
jgi:hypothetical protein